MGLDASWQAVPDPCPLIVRAQDDVQLAIWLDDLRFQLLHPRDYPPPDPGAHSEFVAYCDVLRLTDIAMRGFDDPGRNWDAILYLLAKCGAEDLGRQAVLGTHEVQEDARARFSTASEVRDIARALDAHGEASLRAAFDPADMVEKVYKFSRDDPDRFRRILEAFEGMRSVYRAAAVHGEGVLAILH